MKGHSTVDVFKIKHFPLTSWQVLHKKKNIKLQKYQMKYYLLKCSKMLNVYTSVS